MNQRQFQLYVKRDVHCPHCGTTDETLVPNHRANRGHGGYKAGDQPANILVMCASINGLIESDPHWAEVARKNGWKIRRHEVPADVPFYDMVHGAWFKINNTYGRERAI